MTTFTIDDIKNAIHKFDLMKRPYIIWEFKFQCGLT